MRIHVPATEGHPTFLAEEVQEIVWHVEMVRQDRIDVNVRQINPNSVGVALPGVSRETVQAILAELYRRHPEAKVTTGTNRYRSIEEFEAAMLEKGLGHDQG